MNRKIHVSNLSFIFLSLISLFNSSQIFSATGLSNSRTGTRGGVMDAKVTAIIYEVNCSYFWVSSLILLEFSFCVFIVVCCFLFIFCFCSFVFFTNRKWWSNTQFFCIYVIWQTEDKDTQNNNIIQTKDVEYEWSVISFNAEKI